MSAHSLPLSRRNVHHVSRQFVDLCVYDTQASLLGVLLKCPMDLISIASDVCYGPLNGYSIVIHPKYEMAFVIISVRILVRRTDIRISVCLPN